jgi:tetratricopeptide (TPR) repeat protein
MENGRVVRTRVLVHDDLWVFGSGYLVAPGRVLTAKHVLVPDERIPQLGLPCQIRVWPCGPAEDWIDGSVRWLHPTRDVAVVAVDALGSGLTAVEWGQVTGQFPVEWTAIGYPIASLNEDDRVEEAAYGRLAPTSAASIGGLVLTVESRAPGEDVGVQSGWEGLSGAAVFSGSQVVGIVTADPGHWKKSLTGLRTTHIVDQPELADHLGTPIALAAVHGDVGVRSPTQLRVKGDRVSTAVDFWRDRDVLRADLRRALLEGSGSPRILSVTGRRGIGKSATAAKVVAEFERPDPARSPIEDFDALVYVSTRTGSGSITLAGVYDSFVGLVEDHLADRLRRLWETAKDAALPDLWEAMRHRKCILVLDNLDDLQDPDDGRLYAQDLVALLASICATPHPPRVVTTSQIRLKLPAELDAHVCEFRLEEGLGVEDSIALLRSRDAATGFAQFTDDELRRATERLHGVPHGIEMLGQLLNADSFFLSDLLESQATLDDVLRELVSSVFLNLDEPGRHVVELLALSGVPLPERDVPVILDGLSDVTTLRAALRTLVKHRGITFDSTSRTVRLHPVEADWVRHELLDHDHGRQVALDLRLANWYRERRYPASQRRSLEHVEAQRLEYQHRWRAGDFDEALMVLAQVANFLGHKGETALLRAAVAAADALDLDPRGEVAKEQCRLQVEFFAGSLDRAEAAARTAAEAAESAGMHDVVVEMEIEIGTILRHRGESAASIQVLQHATKDDRHVARQMRLEALVELGLALSYEQRWDEALDVADELSQTLRPDDPRKLAAGPADIRSLARLGVGDYEGALTAAREAISLYLDSPHPDNAGYAHNVAGLVWLQRHDLEQARAQFNDGEQIAAEFKIDRLAGICATNLAWTELSSGDWQACLAAAQRASALLGAAGVRIAGTPRALGELASPGAVGLDPRPALHRAVASARGNTDIYRPSEEILAVVAASLVASGPSRRERHSASHEDPP